MSLSLIRALLPGLLILAVVAYVATLSSSRDKWKVRATVAEQTIQDLAKQSKAQQDKVRTVIKQGEKQIVFVDRKVKDLESRPLPGGCKTPDLKEWEKLL